MDLGRHLLDNPFEERCSGSSEREAMEKVMQADLDCEDRVGTGIKPNTRTGNDGVLELRGGSQVSEGAGCVWEGAHVCTCVLMGLEDRGQSQAQFLSCPSTCSLREGLSSA